MMVLDNKPKIAGTFSEWKLYDLITIDSFYDKLLRNSLPAVRYYVEQKKDLKSRLATALNKDVYTMFKNYHCLSIHRKPTVIQNLLDQQNQQLEKMREREVNFRQSPTNTNKIVAK